MPHAAVAGIGEPDRAVALVHHGVVRCIERFAVEARREDGLGAVVFVSDHAAVAVLAGNLAALIVERVAVAIAAGFAEEGHPIVVLNPSHLQVVRDVAENKVAPDAVPRAALGPKRIGVGVKTLERRVAEFVLVEPRIQRNEVGIRIAGRFVAAPVTGGNGGQAGSGSGCSGKKMASVDVSGFHILIDPEVRAASLGQAGGARKSSRLAKRFRWMAVVHEPRFSIHAGGAAGV